MVGRDKEILGSGGNLSDAVWSSLPSAVTWWIGSAMNILCVTRVQAVLAKNRGGSRVLLLERGVKKSQLVLGLRMVITFPPQGAADNRNPCRDRRVDLQDAPERSLRRGKSLLSYLPNFSLSSKF